ncbi:MAG: ABC transporter substrate-binding protein, partial [Firmicutes bacterium]|nr:ABC transporter substrate-binding protein [Bacillota bacterium]
MAASYRLARLSYPRRARSLAIAGLLLALALVQALALAPAPPVAAASYPTELVDDAGNPVRLEASPQRIVSLVPSLTEAVCALAACDRLVGVDDYSNYPPQVSALPRLGGLYDPNVERIVSLDPDLVLLSKYGRLPQALRQAGLTIFILESETLEDGFRNLRTLGRLLDREERAMRLVESIRQEMQRVAELVRASGRSPSVYYEIDPTPYAAGPDSFIGALIERAGGRNVVPAQLGLFPRSSPELVIQADPEVIVPGDAPYGVTARQLAERPGWAALRALREGQVIALD